MNSAVERLMRLVPPPQPPAARDWPSVAEVLGVSLPADYRDLVDAYGGGRFDGYLWVLEPGCPNENYDLVTSERERAEAFGMLWDFGEPKPEFLEEDGARLVPWGATDNGEFLYWLVRPEQEPEQWAVLVNEARGEEWERYELGCAAFLVGALTGEVRSEILSSGFPTVPHEFRSAAGFR